MGYHSNRVIERMENYYRYEDRLTSGSEMVVIDLLRFVVVKRNPKGAWISRCWGPQDVLHFTSSEKRFVLDGARKRYAFPTEAEALNSFVIRKSRQIWHLEAQLRVAKAAKREAEKPDFKPGKAFFSQVFVLEG